MRFSQFVILVLAALVGLQALGTWLYGWKGLATATAVVVLFLLGGGAALLAWLNGQEGGGEMFEGMALAVGCSSFFCMLTPLWVVLTAAGILAAFTSAAK
jgi:hypothetical protein